LAERSHLLRRVSAISWWKPTSITLRTKIAITVSHLRTEIKPTILTAGFSRHSSLSKCRVHVHVREPSPFFAVGVKSVTTQDMAKHVMYRAKQVIKAEIQTFDCYLTVSQ
jgi:hypothetical protein